MIKFFRKIRRQLMTEGRTGKYLKYAIGEILLVVLGILIALSINNWNEGKQAKKFENELLFELKETLVSDYYKVDMVLHFNKRDQSSCKIILEHLDGNLPYHDSLLLHFRQANNWSKLMLTKNAFDNAKSYVLHFIKDYSTRILLTQL